jgi:hypothetical protein
MSHSTVNSFTVADKPFSKVQSGFLVDTVGCRIPNLDPFDPVVQEFIKREKPLNCQAKRPLLVGVNLTALFILKSALPAFNITDVGQLDCCYQPFWRSKPHSGNGDFDNKVT